MKLTKWATIIAAIRRRRLLEILDPAQNNTFRDHYLDLPFDLSKVFFIATANQLGRFRCRCAIEWKLFSWPVTAIMEKLNIAKQYLIPRQIKENGLQPDQLEITDDAINLLTARYTREAGVRQLERTVGNLARKVALKVAQGKNEKVTITAEDVKGYLGRAAILSRRSPQGIAGGRGDRNGLDGNGRRSFVYRSDAACRAAAA